MDDALVYGRKEPVTPWFGSDSARHYQWYPFVNIGHYLLISNSSGVIADEFLEYYRTGLSLIQKQAEANPFKIGIPFIWCSNNLIASLLNQCLIYRYLSDDNQFYALEAAMRDWLFGCNPWGVSMVIGLPQNGVFPKNPHSALSFLYKYKLPGGLVDGPVYESIFKNLRYLKLLEEDEYALFQSNECVYHDDTGDYSTNEPTMDGTATLVYYLAGLSYLKNK
jgi:hypothetical protein